MSPVTGGCGPVTERPVVLRRGQIVYTVELVALFCLEIQNMVLPS